MSLTIEHALFIKPIQQLYTSGLSFTKKLIQTLDKVLEPMKGSGLWSNCCVKWTEDYFAGDAGIDRLITLRDKNNARFCFPPPEKREG